MSKIETAKTTLATALADKWSPRGESGESLTRAPEHLGDKVARLKLSDVQLLGRANPRVNFANLAPLMADIRLNGLKVPIVVHALSGEALAYVNELNGTKLPDGTQYVTEGARRFTSFTKLDAEIKVDFPAKDAPERARFETIRALVGKAINSRSELIVTIHDNIGREGLTTPTERSRSFAMLRLAGLTLGQIAETNKCSVGQVQDHLRIAALPNNERHGFIRDEIEKYDLVIANPTLDKEAREKALAECVPFSSERIKELAYSFEKSTNPNWTMPKAMKDEPRDFRTVWAECEASRGKKIETPKKSIPISSIDEVRQSIVANFRSDVIDAALAVCDVIRGTLPASALATYHTGSKTAAPAAANAPETLPSVPETPKDAPKAPKASKGRAK
jgi:hypothetical protein